MALGHNTDYCCRAYQHDLPVVLAASALYTADMINNALLSRILR